MPEQTADGGRGEGRVVVLRVLGDVVWCGVVVVVVKQ